MENAADGLKIAFAIFVFVLAISITFVTITQAREVSDIVLQSIDITNFYPQYDRREIRRRRKYRNYR